MYSSSRSGQRRKCRGQRKCLVRPHLTFTCHRREEANSRLQSRSPFPVIILPPYRSLVPILSLDSLKRGKISQFSTSRHPREHSGQEPCVNANELLEKPPTDPEAADMLLTTPKQKQKNPKTNKPKKLTNTLNPDKHRSSGTSGSICTKGDLNPEPPVQTSAALLPAPDDGRN